MNGDTQSQNRTDIQCEQTPIFASNLDSDKEFFRLAMLNLDSDSYKTEHDLAWNNYINFDRLSEIQLQNDRETITSVLIGIDPFFIMSKWQNFILI